MDKQAHSILHDILFNAAWIKEKGISRGMMTEEALQELVEINHKLQMLKTGMHTRYINGGK